jgi:hypothetical protein
MTRQPNSALTSILPLTFRRESPASAKQFLYPGFIYFIIKLYSRHFVAFAINSSGTIARAIADYRLRIGTGLFDQD